MQFHMRLLSALEGVLIAVDAIRANKARAALTILGVAVGVFVVVVISAAIHGINASVAKDFESAGPTTFFVSRFPITFEACDGSGETCAWRRNPPLALDDARAIGALESVRASGARLDMTRPVKYRDRSLPGPTVIGFTSNWTVIDGGGDIYPGRSFTQIEHDGGAPVIILNEKLAANLFGDSDPIFAPSVAESISRLIPGALPAELVDEICAVAAVRAAGLVADTGAEAGPGHGADRLPLTGHPVGGIVVSSSHRRSGVASELLAAHHDAARGAGAMRMLLEVAETNVVARAFYEARGYVEISVRRGYYRNGDDAVDVRGDADHRRHRLRHRADRVPVDEDRQPERDDPEQQHTGDGDAAADADRHDHSAAVARVPHRGAPRL